MNTTNTTTNTTTSTTTSIEALIGPFMITENDRISKALKASGPFTINPYLFAYAYPRTFRISGFVGDEMSHVSGDGQTVDEALANFRADLASKRPSPAKLRAQAEKLLADAAKLEGSAS